ncbi:MAG: hypothetical protein U0670_10125 [Anaerolineae bacterium]
MNTHALSIEDMLMQALGNASNLVAAIFILAVFGLPFLYMGKLSGRIATLAEQHNGIIPAHTLLLFGRESERDVHLSSFVVLWYRLTSYMLYGAFGIIVAMSVLGILDGLI